MSEGKSTYRQALDALSRANKKIDGFKEQGETLMTEGMRTVVSGVTSFVAGACDQRFGKADDLGFRTHKTNGAPTALLAAGVLKGAAAFGAFGKAQTAGFAAGDGAWNHSTSTWGRIAGERLRLKAEKVEQANEKRAAKTAQKKAA